MTILVALNITIVLATVNKAGNVKYGYNIAIVIKETRN